MKFFLSVLFLSFTTSALYSQCNFIKNEFDYALEHDVQILEQTLLFKSEKQVEEPPSIQGYATLQRIGDVKSLWLSIRVPASGSKENPGNLYRGTTVKMRLENKEEVSFLLDHTKSIKRKNGLFIEGAIYLDSNLIETLKSNKIISIEIPWSKGPQQYVASMLFFMQQLPCIN